MTLLINIIRFPSGRASRAEYWGSILGAFAVVGLAFLLIGVAGTILSITLILLTVAFWLAVVVRRMHDLNMTAWNLIWFVPLSFVPVVGFGAGVVLGLIQGRDDDNYYGHSPRYR